MWPSEPQLSDRDERRRFQFSADEGGRLNQATISHGQMSLEPREYYDPPPPRRQRFGGEGGVPQILRSLRKNGQEESRLLSLRRLGSSRWQELQPFNRPQYPFMRDIEGLHFLFWKFLLVLNWRVFPSEGGSCHRGFTIALT